MHILSEVSHLWDDSHQEDNVVSQQEHLMQAKVGMGSNSLQGYLIVGRGI